MYSTRSGIDCEVRKLRQSFALSEGLPFTSLLTPELLKEVAELRQQRVEPTYTSLTTLSLFLSQVLDEDQSCRQAVARLLAELASRQLPACGAGTGGYCKARAIERNGPEEVIQGNNSTRRANLLAMARALGQSGRWQHRIVGRHAGQPKRVPSAQ